MLELTLTEILIVLLIGIIIGLISGVFLSRPIIH